MTRFPVVLFAAVAAAWIPAIAGAQQLPLDRTDPNHRREYPTAPLPRLLHPDPPPLRTEKRHVYRFPGPLGKLVRHNQKLSELCQRGGFKQKIDGLLYATTPGRRYGIGLASGANLYDPFKYRKANMVYFFENADTSRCEVYQATAKTIQHLAVTGAKPEIQ